VDDRNCFITTNTLSRTFISKKKAQLYYLYYMQLQALYWFLSIIYYYITFLSTFFTTRCLFAFVAELNRAGFEFGIHVSAATSFVMKLLASNRLISYCACAYAKSGVSVAGCVVFGRLIQVFTKVPLSLG